MDKHDIQRKYFCKTDFVSLNMKETNKFIHEKSPQSKHDHGNVTFSWAYLLKDQYYIYYEERYGDVIWFNWDIANCTL